jgi:hypothetical protein
MKNSSCCSRGLISTPLALKKLSPDMKACFVMAASGTDKIVGPSHFDQILPAGLLRSKLLLELEKIHALISLFHRKILREIL